MISRKGVTPIVATVLLITISIAAAASAYTFIRNAQQETIEGFESDLNKEQRERKSDINAEYIYNGTNGHIIMNIRNTGSISIPVRDDNGVKQFSLYVNGAPHETSNQGRGWNFVPEGSSIDVLDPSEILTLNTTVPFPERSESTSLKLVGPYEVSDSHVCYNSGSPSC